jgi:hypothetical protein
MSYPFNQKSIETGHKVGNHLGSQQQRQSLEFDGFIGDSCQDEDYDLSGELISIEETYKEMAMYRRSVASTD